MSKKDEVTVYWSPYYPIRPEERYDWNMLYQDPESVTESLKADKKSDVEPNNSIFFCPAYKNMFDNTYVFSNIIDSKFEYDPQNKKFVPVQENQISLARTMEPFMNDRKVIWIPLGWTFFSEEDIEMEIMPPILHDTIHSSYGSITPGRFNISKWYRPCLIEMILRKGVSRFHLAQEPVMYVRFITDKKVNLKRFEMTHELQKLAESVADTKNSFGRFKSLAFRYETFTKSRTRDIVLRKIKEAVLEKD
jgi:hypothetical protein